MAEKDDRRSKQPMRIDPLQHLSDLQAELGRWWDRDWWPFPAGRVGRMPGTTTPRVDMYNEDGDLVIKAELPGVNKEDIEVTLQDQDLVIKAERKSEKEVKEENYYRLERGYGSFYRRLPLPLPVAAQDVSASFKDGVLEVRVAKAATEVAKATKVNVVSLIGKSGQTSVTRVLSTLGVDTLINHRTKQITYYDSQSCGHASNQ